MIKVSSCIEGQVLTDTCNSWSLVFVFNIIPFGYKVPLRGLVVGGSRFSFTDCVPATRVGFVNGCCRLLDHKDYY